MAVNFASLPQQQPVPEKGPSPLVWALVFVVLSMVGIALALGAWPRHSNTHVLRFWLLVVALPVCISAALSLRPFSFFLKRRNTVLAENAVTQAYVQMVFDAASVPLAVLATAYRVRAVDHQNSMEALLACSDRLPTRALRDSREMTVAGCLDFKEAALTFSDTERQSVVLEAVFKSFVAALDDAINAIPCSIPITVRLDIGSTVLSTQAIQAIWHAASAERWPHRLAEPVRLDAGSGLGLIDTMLDCTDPAQRDVVTVLIAMQLSAVHADDPAPGSAEAVCMMLLCPCALAQRAQLPVRAWFHRPQQAGIESCGDALRYALQWGRTRGQLVGGSFCAGFDEAGTARLRIAMSTQGWAGEGASVQDLDLGTLIGDTGSAAPWLAATMALDRAIALDKPHLAALHGDGKVLMAVLAPLEQQAQ